MKCPNCGADHPAGTTFCFYCGEPIPENAGDDSGEWFLSILPTLVMVLWSAAMAVFSTERMSAQ